MSHTLKLRQRQVHLDFHTSGDITGVGAEFDATRFADTLAAAGVDSVTCFARCHHGYLYYPTSTHPERVHPHLQVPDLLNQQIEACHKVGIRCPIYTTVQWDEYTAREHRDWLMIDADGKVSGHNPLGPGFYQNLDVFHPGYRQFLKDHLADIFANVPAVDGLFLDIVQPRISVSEHWLDAMIDEGVDPEDPLARKEFARRVINDWKLETTQHIRAQPGFTDECTIFYNAGHVGPRHRPSADAYTHYELESLPSGGWGYLHFPLAQRFTRTMGKATLGMTGKFHTAWGDFHSYKNDAALQFECFRMAAMGAGCSVGDQLPPDGRLDAATYDLIGGVYNRLAELEPYLVDAQAVSDIAVLTPEAFVTQKAGHAAQAERQPATAMGAVRMLEELQQQFDLVDQHSELEPYHVVVLPDEIPVDAALADKLASHLDRGGWIIASHRSALDADGGSFDMPGWPVKPVGDAPFQPDFIVPGGELVEAALRPIPHVMYQRGLQVEPEADATVLAQVQRPWFNRTWKHFCSHRHAPSNGEVVYPGIVEKRHAGGGGVIYFMHPIFEQYHDKAPRWVRSLLAGALGRALPTPVVAADGPTTLRTSLMRQPGENRHVLHLLHYLPERRGEGLDVIEDVIPLHDVAVTVRLDGIQSVRLVSGGQTLEHEAVDGGVKFTVPRVEGWAVVALTG
jgi:hypothetical protein